MSVFLQKTASYYFRDISNALMWKTTELNCPGRGSWTGGFFRGYQSLPIQILKLPSLKFPLLNGYKRQEKDITFAKSFKRTRSLHLNQFKDHQAERKICRQLEQKHQTKRFYKFDCFLSTQVSQFFLSINSSNTQRCNRVNRKNGSHSRFCSNPNTESHFTP